MDRAFIGQLCGGGDIVQRDSEEALFLWEAGGTEGRCAGNPKCRGKDSAISEDLVFGVIVFVR